MASPFLTEYPGTRQDATWGAGTITVTNAWPNTWTATTSAQVYNVHAYSGQNTGAQIYWNGQTGTGSYAYALDSWYTYSGVGVVNEPERRVRAEVRIAAQLFADHPDPDALLGEQMDELRRQLEEAVGVAIPREAVWEQWCSDSIVATDEVVIRAEWTPRSLTIDAWEAWQDLPKMRRVWDYATRRYTEVDEAEFKRRNWKAEREKLVSKMRKRTRDLRARIAERRAEALLVAHLDEEQAREWTEKRSFHVHTADGERTYWIKRGRAGNIYLVKGVNPRNRNVKRFCFHEYHPGGQVPIPDNLLAQKLFIEANEEQFLAIANPA